jgi:hypothetical protein
MSKLQVLAASLWQFRLGWQYPDRRDFNIIFVCCRGKEEKTRAGVGTANSRSSCALHCN